MPTGLRANAMQNTFESALTWDAYLATDPDKAEGWRELHERIQLTDAQRTSPKGV